MKISQVSVVDLCLFAVSFEYSLVSETRRPAVIYTSNSLDGPWEREDTITTEANGFPVDASEEGNLYSNTTLWVRPDGGILGTSRDGYRLTRRRRNLIRPKENEIS